MKRSLLALSALLLICCGDDSSTSTPTSSAPDARSETFAIPAQINLLQGRAVIAVESDQADTVRLRVSQFKGDPFTLKVPVGAVLEPVGDVNASRRVIVEPVAVAINGGMSQAVKAVRLDIGNWDQDAPEYTFTAFDLDAPLTRVLQALHQAGKSWSVHQVAAWTIESDIDVDQLNNKSITEMSVMGGPGTAVSYRLWSYNNVMAVRDAMEHAQVDPGQYKIFTGNAVRRDEAIEKHTVADWSQDISLAYSGNQFNGLKEYMADPAVRDLVMNFARHHEDPSMRAAAGEFLIDNNLLADRDEAALYDMAVNDDARMLRIVAAATLLKQGDNRAEPLLVVYGQDTYAYNAYSKVWQYNVERERNTVFPQTGTLLAHWQKDLGGKVAPQLKADHEKLMNLEAQYIRDALREGDLQKLAKRFARSQVVFDHIAGLAKTLPEPREREYALRALNVMKTGDPFDVAMDRMTNDSSENVRKAASRINLDDDPAKRKRFAVAALKADDAMIRSQGFQKINEDVMDGDIDALLADIALRDDNESMRKQAIEKMQRANAPSLVAVCEKILTANDEPENVTFAAMRQLSRAEVGEPAYDLLVKTAESHGEAKVRGVALSSLNNFRKDFPVLDVAAARMAADDSSSVQVAAVLMASRLYPRRGEDAARHEAIIKQGLQSPHADVRKMAADVCKSKRIAAMKPLLEKVAADDPDEKVLRAAASAVNALK